MKGFLSCSSKVASALILAAACGCGGSSGSSLTFSGTAGEQGQRILIMDPVSDAIFSPGQSIAFMLHTENFTLQAPPSHADKHVTDADNLDVEALREAAEAAGLLEDEHEHQEETASASAPEPEHADDGHTHDSNSVHGHATAGHYHVYLDAASDTDPHVTAWSHELEYSLPAEIEPGPHSLRFELRDDQHVKVGAETVYFFIVGSAS